MALCSPGAGGCARPGRKCLFTACFLIEDMPGPRASAGFYTGDLRSLPVFQTQRTVFKERDECEVLWAYSRAVPSPVAALLFIYPFIHSWGARGKRRRGTRHSWGCVHRSLLFLTAPVLRTRQPQGRFSHPGSFWNEGRGCTPFVLHVPLLQRPGNIGDPRGDVPHLCAHLLFACRLRPSAWPRPGWLL